MRPPAAPASTRMRWVWLVVLAALAFAASAFATRLLLARADGPPAAAAPPPPAAPVPDRYTGLAGGVVRFAGIDEARALLGADDDWVAITGELQRASLMGAVDRPAPRDAFRRFLSEQALAWPDDQRQRWLRALEQAAPGFNRLGLKLPRDVLLVRTTGREGADTPHTRQNAVFLPRSFDQQQFTDVELLVHELWHIVSRHDPALRTRAYATLGYVPAPPLEFPPAWAAARLANQDATHHAHLMWVTLQGRPVALMPVLVADADELRAGGTIVTAAQPRLLEVIPGSGGAPTRAVIRRGEPVWHDPETTAPYLEKLGGNSDYLTHPEETMADNVMFLVSGRKVPNPGLQDRIRAALAAR